MHANDRSVRPQPGVLRGRARVAAVIGLGVGLAGAFATLTPAGLPYDEPAHLTNVRFYAEHLRLPVLGDPGVHYEAHQPPLYYALCATVIRLVQLDQEGALIAARFVGVMGWGLALTAVFGLLRHVAPHRPRVALLGTAMLALNPMLLAVAGSAQNDSLALGSAFGTMWLAVRPAPAGPGLRRGVVIGACAAATVLTKVTLVPLLAVVIGWSFLRRGRVLSAVAAATAVVLSGWWVVRNLVLYGDLTGQRGVVLSGTDFPTTAQGPAAYGRQVVTYLSIPTEYYRNELVSPLVTDLLAIVLLAVLVVGLGRAFTTGLARTEGGVLIVSAGLASGGLWLLENLLSWPVPFRLAYGVLPVVALSWGAQAFPRRRALQRGLIIAALLVEIALLAWVLASLPALPDHALLG